MDIFPITKVRFDDQDEAFNEILGYQVLDSKGLVIGNGETPAEAQEAALVAMFLSESNDNGLKPVKRNRRLLSKR